MGSFVEGGFPHEVRLCANSRHMLRQDVIYTKQSLAVALRTLIRVFKGCSAKPMIPIRLRSIVGGDT